ncbi:RHS repeat-associated core domain-containing protein [bacterium]|nr:RHS repeat-associated core domain-containing protein [bacterium]MBP9810269.1 RHS repeat-associated core domain-containing protein [bacterium]
MSNHSNDKHDTASKEDCGCGCGGCADSNNGKDESGKPVVKLVKEFTPETNAVLIAAAAAASAPDGFDGTIDTGESDVLAPTRPVPPTEAKPGRWVPLPQQPSVDVDTARRDIESRKQPTNIYKPGAANPAPAHALPGVKSLATGFAGNTVAGPASIVELSRALKSNVDLIYEWVFNNVESLSSYGIQKGGLGAIIDGLGNSFDQADLMIQLLRQAGYTANYQFGTLRMTGAQAGAWLGTDTANVYAANNLLANSGVPTSVVNISGVDGVEFSHCWVLCNIGGTNYVFDPVQKTYTTKSAINLATAMGYNASTFLTNAKSGATVTADYVQNMNRANIRADLDTMTDNLVNWIKTNDHAAGMDDILGGRNIVQYDAATPLRQTAHPYLKSGSSVTTWTSVPQAYKATMHTVYDTIDITFNTEDLAGKRLTLTFNGSLEGELRLDGTLIGTSTAQGVGTWNSVLFDIVHPYAVTWADQYVWQQVWADKPYLLCNSWGNLSSSSTGIHGVKLGELTAAFASPTSEPVVGETMAQMWKTMDTMVSRMADITNRMSNCTSVMHHSCGLIGWFDTTFTDIGAVMWGTSALDNNYNQQQANDTALAMHGVALEAQIMREFQTSLGVSTTPIIDIANSAGQKIYDAKTANWLGTVEPALVNYSAGDKSNIENWYINNGDRVGLPENGSISLNSWTGLAYYVIPTWGTFGIIGGGLKGGSASWSNLKTEIAPAVLYQNYDKTYNGNITPVCSPPPAYNPSGSSQYAPALCKGDYSSPAGQLILPIGDLPGARSGKGGGGSVVPGTVTSSEPIDLLSGAYLLDATDISVGSAGFPYGLSFARTYSSAQKNQFGPLGRGWRHNYQITAGRDTIGLAGMGNQTTIGAAATIVEAFVSYDLQTDLTKPFDKYITNALTNQWFVDNLSDNVVTINSGFSSQLFVKLPDGTYANPALDAGTVTLAAGLYTYTSLTGSQLNFNSNGHIATMVEPAGVTVTFGYDSGAKLISVTNGLGRTLTINYGTDNMISTVTDGTGRSVVYTVDTNGDLTTVTDPNTKDWTYEYDIPGRMIKLFKPANPTVAIVTNTYDTLGRVKEQADYQSNVWQYFFAGSRTEEVNPNAKSGILYINSLGKVAKAISLVGKISTSVFDGRGRTVKSTAPEGNSVEFVYDSKNRVTQTTAKAKPASGLADIVTSATYDATWNKVKTTTDNMGRVTTMNYDVANGNLLSVVSPSVTGLGSSTVTMTYNARGQVLTVTGPDGIVTKNTFDAATEKLLSSVGDFGVGRLNLTANFGHDSVGNVTSVQDPRGFTSTSIFDVLRRVTQATTTAPFSFVTKFTFDDNGNTTKVERQTNDPTDPWQTSQASYTADNKVLTTTSPQGSVTSIAYDNLQRRWKVTDALGRVVTNNFDDANRVVSVLDPSSITAVTYTYTNNGKVATIKDARNFVTTCTFDGHDRPLRTTYQDATYEEISSYDGNSNPLTLRTRSGATITLTYDELNRVKTKAPIGQPTVTTGYDIAGRITTVSTPVVAGDPSSGTFTNFYDTAGRGFREQYPDGNSVVHVLDANSNITRTTYPDGYFVDRVYDELNRMTDIKLNGAGSSAVQFQYDALSRRTKLVYENGCTTNYTFEVDNDLSSVLQNFVGSNVQFNYSFDSANQMVMHRISDPANFRWTPPAPATTTYGTANNINQYPTVGGTGYTYSTNGCLTNDGTLKYEFNTERLMTRVRNAATDAIIADYLYDPALRQRQKNVGGVTTNYYYSGFQRLAEYDGSAGTPGILLNRYVYGTGMDEVLIQITAGGTKTYYHQNHQGSVVATTNSSGAVLNRYTYGPFGESVALIGTTHGYTGQRYDPETELYYYKMRQYSSKLGRFLQPDPIGMAGGMNLYAYVGNSPLGAVDPYGLKQLTISLGYSVDYALGLNKRHASLLVYSGSGLDFGLSVYVGGHGTPKATTENALAIIGTIATGLTPLVGVSNVYSNVSSAGVTMEAYNHYKQETAGGQLILYSGTANPEIGGNQGDWSNFLEIGNAINLAYDRLKTMMGQTKNGEQLSSRIPYLVLDQNSNSWVHALLLMAGHGLDAKAGNLAGFLPGWENTDFINNPKSPNFDLLDPRGLLILAANNANELKWEEEHSSDRSLPSTSFGGGSGTK